MALLLRRFAVRASFALPLIVFFSCDDGKRLCFCGDDDGMERPDGAAQFPEAFGSRPKPDVDVADAIAEDTGAETEDASDAAPD